MIFGLKESDIQKINKVFSKYSEIEKSIIYGSRAKGNYSFSSDIDLTLVGDSLNLSKQFEIENELDDLLLPYKIDLSLIHKISNKKLVEHIERVGQVFYQKK